MKVYPMIGIDTGDVKSAVNECNRAFEQGVDGVYLTDVCNGVVYNKPLFNAYEEILSNSPEKYVGINIFGSGPFDAMNALTKHLKEEKSSLTPSALLIDEMRMDGLKKSDAIELRGKEPLLRGVRLVGGVAMKRSGSYTEDPKMATYETEWLKDSVDVVLTGGELILGSGSRIEKLNAMKESAGDKPLAVIGAISVEDIVKYGGTVDEVIVSSGIEASFHGAREHNQRRLKELVEMAHKFAN